jgi:hypothetical protein
MAFPKLPALLLALAGTARALAGQEITFYLVPESAWAAEATPPSALLGEGTIYLYREGSYAPSAVFPANQPHRVKPGNWVWIAEAPGYVSVGTGALRIGPGSTGEKRLLWPVVPACRIDLKPSPGWNGVQRFDLVSLDRAAVYPVLPASRSSAWVPAGRFLAYSTGPAGLLAISPPAECRHAEVRAVEPPSPPARGFQDLLLRMRLPDGFDPGSEQIQVGWSAPAVDSTSGQPAATLRQGSHLSAFFLGVPAAEEIDLAAVHTGLRTVRQPVEPLEESARELPEIRLRPRRTLDLTIDYRPKAAHKSEAVQLLFCGRGPRPPKIPGRNPCSPVGPELRLRPGISVYSFPGLDDGLYHPEARIDGEVLLNLGSGVSVYFDPATESVDPVPPALLQEMEIYGNILVEGEPVAGSLRIEPASPGGLPSQSFATDGDLIYHWTFFGRLSWMQEPGDEPRLGFFSGMQRILACTDEGLCRDLGLHSELRGEGRLDIEVRPGREVTVEVVDAAGGAPLADAAVRFRSSLPDLKFDSGRVEWTEPVGAELSHPFRTGSDGRITLSVPRDLLEPIVVTRREYREGHAEPPPGAGPVELRVALEPEVPREAGLRFILQPSGKPLSQAFLLVLRGDGSRDPGCSATTDAEGTAELGNDCLRGASVVVFHPEAEISLLRGEALLASGQVGVDAAPARPVVLRAVDAAGMPVPRLPVRLQYGSFSVEPNDLLMAASRTGSLLFYTTQSDGSVELRGVNPSSAHVPQILSADPDRKGSVTLLGVEPGGTVELVVR